MMPDTAIRLHAFDNLRAWMMWLGIVLHSAMLYMEPSDRLTGSPQTSLVATSLFGWIHTFRMPVFFIMAGFFAMLLIERRGLAGTLRNRAFRLALPFIIFWPVLLICVNLIIMAHMQKSGADLRGITIDFDRMIISTGHLWFLYFLMMICVVILPTLNLARIVTPESLKDKLYYLNAAIFKNWWGIVLLAWPGVVLSRSYPLGIISGDSSFTPSATSLAYYAIFYLFGVLFYRARDDLLSHFEDRIWIYFVGALFFFVFANVFGFIQMGLLLPALDPTLSSLAFRWLYGIATWLWCFFFIGFFLKYLNRQNRILRYVADSSYWVYLSHYPVVLLFAFFLYDLDQHALTKMSILIVATSVVTFFIYQIFVRRTVIARILSGTGST